MTGMSRRTFLASTATLAAVWGLSFDQLGTALAKPAKPSEAPTTLLETIRQRSVAAKGEYRTLVAGPGEPYFARVDLLSKTPTAARSARRRSLAYLGHMTDIHIMDAQSPARLEPLAAQSPSTWAGAIRPQDTLTVNVQAAMVKAMSEARYSPLTGAPMAAMVNTGDSADMHSTMELRWYIDMMDGVSVKPNSGAPGVYEGPQAWQEASYAYHPENPGTDAFGRYGFPTIPGMLSAAVSQTVTGGGMPVPWYAVYGNHDSMYYGTFPMGSALHALAIGDRKPVTWEALGSDYFAGMAAETSALNRLIHDFRTNFGLESGFKAVTSDPQRKLFDQAEFMAAHFQTQSNPGPVGHGFTQRNLDTGETWWTTDVGPHLRLFGLDTCNTVVGADGAVPADQFEWLKGQLGRLQEENKLAIVLSHHNSATLENTAVLTVGKSQKLYHAEECVAMLNEFPNVVAWVNGHTHINTIQAHPRKDGNGGFWEITTASCIDFPQQQQLMELVDNRDGTMSIFTTVLDHASLAVWRQGDFSEVGLASLSRELASNDWIANPLMRMGSAPDRNCELLMPAPFDLSKITDAELEKTAAARKARLIAREKGQRS